MNGIRIGRLCVVAALVSTAFAQTNDNTAIIVGSVVGGGGGLLLIFIGLFFFLRNRKNKKVTHDHHESTTTTPSKANGNGHSLDVEKEPYPSDQKSSVSSTEHPIKPSAPTAAPSAALNVQAPPPAKLSPPPSAAPSPISPASPHTFPSTSQPAPSAVGYNANDPASSSTPYIGPPRSRAPSSTGGYSASVTESYYTTAQNSEAGFATPNRGSTDTVNVIHADNRASYLPPPSYNGIAN